MIFKQPARRGIRGFNLIEAAIVLGIVGLIVGGIWVAASAVYQNLRISRGTNQLLQVTQAIRSLHATQTTITTGDITASLAPGGVFPSDMLSNEADTSPENPWGGATLVGGIAAVSATGGAGFWVIFNGLSRDACINMGIRNTGQGRDAGLERVSLSNAVQAATLANTAGVAPDTMTIATATAACTSTTGTNSAAFLFRLRT